MESKTSNRHLILHYKLNLGKLLVENNLLDLHHLLFCRQNVCQHCSNFLQFDHYSKLFKNLVSEFHLLCSWTFKVQYPNSAPCAAAQPTSVTWHCFFSQIGWKYGNFYNWMIRTHTQEKQIYICFLKSFMLKIITWTFAEKMRKRHKYSEVNSFNFLFCSILFKTLQNVGLYSFSNKTFQTVSVLRAQVNSKVLWHTARLLMTLLLCLSWNQKQCV